MQQDKNSKLSITILGAGAWGSAIANCLANKHNITLWLRNRQQLIELNTSGYNQKYLPDIKLNNNIYYTDDLKIAIEKSNIVIISTPTYALESIVHSIRPLISLQYLVWLCKGFINFNNNVLLPHQILELILPNYNKIGVLTGPSFAQEVALGLPCALTLASKNINYQIYVQNALHQPNLRIYTSDDVIGCELGGALKNVLAIATGICAGLNLGLNAQAALITRGISEIMRLSTVLGANPHTLMGLSGLGDLILTATGNLSRNRSVGFELGQGKTLNEILKKLGHVAEGVNSTKLVYTIVLKHNIDAPLICAVYDVLFNQITPLQALEKLLSRQIKQEHIFRIPPIQ